MKKKKDIEAFCNHCGETCYLGHHDIHVSNHGLIACTVSGGYFSTPGNGCGALDDTTTYTFSLCEFCLDHLFSQFKVPPKIDHYMGGSDEPEIFTAAADRVKNDDWRGQKGKILC